MRRIRIALIVAMGSCAVFLFAGEVSPSIWNFRSAGKTKCEQAVKEASAKYEQAVYKATTERENAFKAASRRLVADLEAEMKVATRREDLDLAVKIRDAKEAALAGDLPGLFSGIKEQDGAALSANSFRPMCWQDHWIAFPMSVVEVDKHKGIFGVKNTTGIHDHIVLAYWAEPLLGDFELRTTFKGHGLCLLSTSGRDWVIGPKTPWDKTSWTEVRAVRKDGHLSFYVNGKSVPNWTHPQAGPREDEDYFVGFGIKSGEILQVRSFTLKTSP